MKLLFVRLAALLMIVVPASGVIAGTAQASDDDVELRGRCANGVEWKMKAKPDDGRIEVEAEIDSGRRGQRWNWVLTHNGSFSAQGASRTSGESGSFDVERTTVDVPGTDTFRFRATRRRAVCVATISY